MCVYSSDSVDSLVLKDWGRIVAQFIRDQWTCLSFLQKSAGTLQAPEVPEVLRAAVDALALLPGHLVLPVLDFMASILPQVGHSCTSFQLGFCQLGCMNISGLKVKIHVF